MPPSLSLERGEAGSQQPVRRLASRRPSVTHVLIAVVVILAFILNLLVLADRDATVLVPVADRALPAGSTLDPSAFRLVPMAESFEGVESFVPDSELAGLDGWVLQRSLVAGAVLDRGSVVAPSSESGHRTMSIPIEPEHAAGGALVAGDTVDVITVIDGDAHYTAVGLRVVSTPDLASGAIGSTSSFHVVLAVEADEALRIAEALELGSIELVRSTGAPLPPSEGETTDDS